MSKNPKPTFDQHTAAMHKLEQELAYSAARSDIECECVAVDLPNGPWWDISLLADPMLHLASESTPEVCATLIRAVKYLEWRGCIERLWGSPHIVHIKDAT